LKKDSEVMDEHIPCILDQLWDNETKCRVNKAATQSITPQKGKFDTSTSVLQKRKAIVIASPMEWPLKLVTSCCEESGIDHNGMSKKEMISAIADIFDRAAAVMQKE
jgi:hypothetical protein